MKVMITEQQFNNLNIIYTAVFVDREALLLKYPPMHENVFSQHSTIEFKPKDVSGTPFGEKITMEIKGRLTTDRVDVLLVENPMSTNPYPHITLSTAAGVKPFESNTSIKDNIHDIVALKDEIEGTYGFFDGQNVHTDIIVD